MSAKKFNLDDLVESMRLVFDDWRAEQAARGYYGGFDVTAPGLLYKFRNKYGIKIHHIEQALHLLNLAGEVRQGRNPFPSKPCCGSHRAKLYQVLPKQRFEDYYETKEKE